jgi:hypothetical protein
MPAPFLTGALRFLQKVTVATFSGPEKLWWPAGANTAEYTVPIDCAAAPQDGQSKELAGLLTLATDGRVFHCTLSDFPFPPQPEMIFVFGPPSSGAPASFDPATSQKFIVKSTKTWGEQVTVTAELHSEA